MATGKIELNGIQFEPLTVNFTTYNCSGTIAIPDIIYISTDKKFLWCMGTRVAISNFSRTGANPGIAANTNIIPTKGITCTCGMRIDGSNVRPETVYITLDLSGVLSIKTSESYTNATGNPLILMVNSCIIPLT